ncbi:hypothetical protein [Glaciimonas sp. PCH181]|uniref:hypothetical protein n=1 Tax=Glaciimonas sp. PCH181 TaxID=2133943 RepID=UPI000D33A602|nr:hypothetical protein [Glaciimonas sp. PCH181]PUA16740.1 hypothetical protein C7W93_22390 [Glaciimonas sp. PCH181]
MRKQITRIAPLQTTKVLAVLYFSISLPFIILSSLIMLAMPGTGGFSIWFLLTPIMYAVFGFLFTLFGAWVYNKVAPRIGGIEFTTSEVENASTSL